MRDKKIAKRKREFLRAKEHVFTLEKPTATDHNNWEKKVILMKDHNIQEKTFCISKERSIQRLKTQQ